MGRTTSANAQRRAKGIGNLHLRRVSRRSYRDSRRCRSADGTSRQSSSPPSSSFSLVVRTAKSTPSVCLGEVQSTSCEGRGAASRSLRPTKAHWGWTPDGHRRRLSRGGVRRLHRSGRRRDLRRRGHWPFEDNAPNLVPIARVIQEDHSCLHVLPMLQKRWLDPPERHDLHQPPRWDNRGPLTRQDREIDGALLPAPEDEEGDGTHVLELSVDQSYRASWLAVGDKPFTIHTHRGGVRAGTERPSTGTSIGLNRQQGPLAVQAATHGPHDPATDEERWYPDPQSARLLATFNNVLPRRRDIPAQAKSTKDLLPVVLDPLQGTGQVRRNNLLGSPVPPPREHTTAVRSRLLPCRDSRFLLVLPCEEVVRRTMVEEGRAKRPDLAALAEDLEEIGS